MADITMCQDDFCPVKDVCKRHECSGTRASKYQSYAGYKHATPYGCAHFYAIKPVEAPVKAQRA